MNKDYTQNADHGPTTPLLRFNIILDEQVFTINRKVYTIVDALESIGGMMGIAYTIASFLLKGI